MEKIADNIEKFTNLVGGIVSWLTVIMVLVQFFVVLLRYVFGYGSIFAQESILYMHGYLFMLGASYTLLKDGHVRVDIFYREADEYKKALVNFWGVIGLLFPVLLAIAYYGFPYVLQSWHSLEGSKETSGIPFVYGFKSAIVAFVLLMGVQGFAMLLRSYLVLQNTKPAKKI